MGTFALSLIAFIVLIGPLILIHELGHFIAARLIGVTVLEFGIGFPPRALKLFEQGGTEFTLNWLPIGGFVRPLGEDFVRPISEAATDEERAIYEKRQGQENELRARNIKTKSVMEAGPWQRIFFMIAGVVMNLLTGLVLFTLAALIGIPVLQSATVQVRGVATNSPAAQAGIKIGDVITAVNGQPVILSSDLDPAFGKVDQAVPLTIKRGDQTLTLTLTPSSKPTGDVNGVFVTDVAVGSPGEKAGLKPGDRILKMDDQLIAVNSDLLTFDGDHMGKQVQMTFERSGTAQTVPITLNAAAPAIGASIAVLQTNHATGLQILDTNPISKVVPQSLGDALRMSAADTWNVIKTTAEFPAKLISGGVKNLQQARPVSVIGISQMGAQVIQESSDTHQSYPILDFAALLSVAIGLTQLLPIPGLDGGRILFVLVELLRGKPLRPEREGLVNLVGLGLLLCLMLVFVVNDLLKPDCAA